MKKRLRPKKYVLPCLYVALFTSVMLGAFFITKSMRTSGNAVVEEETPNYVSREVISQDVPVINETEKMIKPYNNEGVTVGKSYYDYKAEAQSQEKSLIYYENTYMQSSGASYGKKDPFQVLAILDGEVTSVEEDDILGRTIQIKHENDIISSYQSLSEVSVKVGDKVKQGDILGNSGKSNLEKDLGNHLYFELVIKDMNVNPEEYFDKSVSEI